MLSRHPLRAVAAIAAPVAIGHAVWIATHRVMGAYDPDEAGYLATALDYHRTVVQVDPVGFVRSVGATANGPVVPLLSLGFLLVGPVDPRTAMMVQPLLLVVTAVLVAAITRHVAGPLSAVAAGAVCVAMPVFGLAAQSYWYGLGAAAVTAATLLALLESDRLSNRWSWAFGIGLGLMVMTRTMTLGFVPGIVVAAAVLVWPERARLRRLGATLLVGVATAGPWLLVNWNATFGYLVGYGYGARAGLFGSGDVFDRLEFRVRRIAEGAGVGEALASLLGTALLAALVTRSRGGPEPDPAVRRRRCALGIVVVCGIAALVSTSNQGVWFELPLFVPLIALLAAAVASAPVVLRSAVIVAFVCMAILVNATSWWLLPLRSGQLGFGLIGSHYEPGFALYDERFSPSRRNEGARAAEQWAGLSDDVERELRALAPPGEQVAFTFSGSFMLFNTNTVRLAAERRDWAPRISTPDTTLSRSALLAELTAVADIGRGRTARRFLVVALHDQHLFTPDAEVRRFAQLARERGWRAVRRFVMPDGGEVQILHLS